MQLPGYPIGHHEQYFKEQRRGVTVVRLDDIEFVCRCGALGLRPENDYERHYGGKTILRKNVTIMDGSRKVKRLRGKVKMGGCNRCINKW